MTQPGNPTEATTAVTNGMSIEFIEKAAHWFGVAVVVFGLLTAFATVGAWYFSRKEAAAKGEALERFKAEARKAAAEAHERAARLEAAAATARLEVEHLKLRLAPRRVQLLASKFTTLLENKPTGSARLFYVPDDMEAREFADSLWWAVTDAGWQAADPQRFPRTCERMISERPRMRWLNLCRRKCALRAAANRSL